jgi:hypothetical protein
MKMGIDSYLDTLSWCIRFETVWKKYKQKLKHIVNKKVESNIQFVNTCSAN